MKLQAAILASVVTLPAIAVNAVADTDINPTQLICGATLKIDGKIISKTRCTDQRIIVRDAKGSLLFIVDRSSGRITGVNGKFIGKVSAPL